MIPNASKIGRNDTCPCGSGGKYKKCCLAIEENLESTALREGAKRLKSRIQDKDGDRFVFMETGIKMSEIILHLAEDLLEIARTKSQRQFAITITCMAWNIAVIPEPERRTNAIEKMVKTIEGEEGQEEVREIVNSIIEKKNRYYPEIGRIIVDYELSGNRDNLHLNIASTYPSSD